MAMSVGAALEAGYVGRSLSRSVPWDLRCCYVFCPVCSEGRFDVMASRYDSVSALFGPDGTETEEEMEDRVVRKFIDEVPPSCESVRSERSIREVMDA